MTKIVWKDITTFSQGEKVKVPRTFEAKISDNLNVVVTRHIHQAPDEWVLTCRPWFNCEVVGTDTIEEAQTMALKLVKGKIVEMLEAFDDD